MRAISFTIAVFLGFTAVQSNAAGPSDSARVCRIMHERMKRLGTTITFAGQYITDHIERSAIVPAGCDRGIGVGQLSPEAEKILDSINKPPFKSDSPGLEAIFTGTLVQYPPNDFTFRHDDGVRLDVTNIKDLTVRKP